MAIQIRITNGRPGSWYEKKKGKKYTSSEEIAGDYVCDEETKKVDGKVTKKFIIRPEDVKILK